VSIFERIAIGVANWNEQKPYGHRGVTCPRAEQEKILAYCQSAGIDTIHTKKAYGVDLSWVSSAFRIVRSDEFPNYSLYDPSDWLEVPGSCNVLQFPYSPFDRRWEEVLADDGWYETPEFHARSCFCQGKVFSSDEPVFVRFRKYAGEMGIPVGTLCILFCLLNPNVDKVIVGVDSEEQLREDLRFFHRMGSFGVEDPKIIDPRRWTQS
jgi:aryl-alcohol dehydrogenase-like predicted oxidoreductase